MAAPLPYYLLRPIIVPLFRRHMSLTGVDYLPDRGGYILAANHVDWLDGFYVAAALAETRDVPVFFLTVSNNYWWTRLAVQIPSQKADIIDAAVASLHRGWVICNFIEGQRNPNGRLLPGKTGTVRMAALAGAPIVPLGITCSSQPTMAQSLHRLLRGQDRVRLSFGQPLIVTPPVGELTPDWLRQETERVMRAIMPLCGKTV